MLTPHIAFTNTLYAWECKKQTISRDFLKKKLFSSNFLIVIQRGNQAISNCRSVNEAAKVKSGIFLRNDIFYHPVLSVGVETEIKE